MIKIIPFFYAKVLDEKQNMRSTVAKEETAVYRTIKNER
jgi:hypothetical protein